MNDEVLSKEGISSPNNENIEVLAGENETSHNLIMPSFDSDESAILNQRAKNMLDSKDYKLQNDKIKASLESIESAEKDNKDSIISNLALVFALVFACVFALRAVKLKKQTPQTPQNPLSSNTSANSSGDSNELNFDNAKGGIYGNF